MALYQRWRIPLFCEIQPIQAKMQTTSAEFGAILLYFLCMAGPKDVGGID